MRLWNFYFLKFFEEVSRGASFFCGENVNLGVGVIDDHIFVYLDIFECLKCKLRRINDNMTTAKENLYKALMLRLKAFKDVKVTKSQLIKYHWFNRYFVVTLEKLSKDGTTKAVTFDLTNNQKAFEFNFNLNDFKEAQKLCKDITCFVKDEEAEKITRVLMSIL